MSRFKAGVGRVFRCKWRVWNRPRKAETKSGEMDFCQFCSTRIYGSSGPRLPHLCKRGLDQSSGFGIDIFAAEPFIQMGSFAEALTSQWILKMKILKDEVVWLIKRWWTQKPIHSFIHSYTNLVKFLNSYYVPGGVLMSWKHQWTKQTNIPALMDLTF